MCVCVCVAAGFLFYRPLEQKYGSQLESNAAGSHSEEPCWIPSGIIGPGKQVIAWIALNFTTPAAAREMRSSSATAPGK